MLLQNKVVLITGRIAGHRARATAIEAARARAPTSPSIPITATRPGPPPRWSPRSRPWAAGPSPSNGDVAQACHERHSLRRRPPFRPWAGWTSSSPTPASVRSTPSSTCRSRPCERTMRGQSARRLLHGAGGGQSDGEARETAVPSWPSARSRALVGGEHADPLHPDQGGGAHSLMQSCGRRPGSVMASAATRSCPAPSPPSINKDDLADPKQARIHGGPHPAGTPGPSPRTSPGRSSPSWPRTWRATCHRRGACWSMAAPSPTSSRTAA